MKGPSEHRRRHSAGAVILLHGLCTKILTQHVSTSLPGASGDQAWGLHEPGSGKFHPHLPLGLSAFITLMSVQGCPALS